MEQTNLMPPNGNLAAQQNGQMPQAMNRMQQPQQGNLAQQIHPRVIQELRNTMAILPAGWQQTFDIRERANKLMQL
jgi:hypothetical protein